MKPRKLVYGIGVNDAGYEVTKYGTVGCGDGKQKRKQVWMCPYYQVWKSMLVRCYSKKYQECQPTYKGCSVSKDWLTFRNFKSWMETQDFEGMQLDKDLLFEGNKAYSADTCVFVTQMVNSFTTDRGAARGEWMLGVIWHKKTEKYQARCSNPFNNKREYLGLFTSEQDAHEAWRKRKQELAHELAAIQTDERVAEALINRYTRIS